MTKNIKKITIFIILLFMILPSFTLVHAQLRDYEVLAPLPGIENTNLSNYLPRAFNLAVGIALGLAFVMITFGGVMYATSDAITGKSQGKEYIQNALWGLLLVISSFVILATLNPKILEFSLIIDRPDVKASDVTLATIATLEGPALSDDSSIRGQLGGAGITINNGPCRPGETSGCTNVNGLPSNVITGLSGLRSVCKGCSIVITGGTEGGHATHGPGRAIVDIRPSTGLNHTIWNSVNNPPDGYTRSIKLPDGKTVKVTFESKGGNVRGTSTGAHWHAVFD